MADMALNLATFCAVFRASVGSSLEYSISDDLDTFGTMVRGDSNVLDTLGAFVIGTSFAGDWYSATARMFREMGPPASLFRVDWRADRPVAMTLYMKFAQAPTDSEFEHLLAAARPFRWYGPSPAAVGEAVGLAGPTGVALRSTAAGSGHTAVYYVVEARRRALGRDALSRLLRAADVPCGAERILADSVTLAANCPLSVIGLDSGSPESRGALKFDWGEVPPRVARALLSSKGTRHRALTRLDELSSSLRARWLSYLGMKYASSGYAGWRAYFSTEPHRYIPAGLPSVQAGDRSRGARMPHY